MGRTELWLALWVTIYENSPTGSTWASIALETNEAYASVFPHVQVLATDVSLEIEEAGSIYYEGSKIDEDVEVWLDEDGKEVEELYPGEFTEHADDNPNPTNGGF